jgi:hypothetical protein
VLSSVEDLDPDPDPDPKLFAGSGSRKIIPDPSCSGSEMNLNKTNRLKFDNFSKNFQFKNANFFFGKKIYLESLYIVIICYPNLRLEHQGKIYVKNVINNSCRIRNQLKNRIQEKNHFSPQHCCLLCLMACVNSVYAESIVKKELAAFRRCLVAANSPFPWGQTNCSRNFAFQ